MMLPNVLNHCMIIQELVGQVDTHKRFWEHPYLLVYFAARSRGWAFRNSREQEVDVKRGHCQNCSVSQDLGRLSSIQQIPVGLVIS